MQQPLLYSTHLTMVLRRQSTVHSKKPFILFTERTVLFAGFLIRSYPCTERTALQRSVFSVHPSLNPLMHKVAYQELS